MKGLTSEVYPYIASLAVALLDGCSDSATVIATLDASDPVEVRSSINGGGKTCYAITAVVDGKPVKGFVLGAELTSVAAFERQRIAPEIVTVASAPVAAVVPQPAEIPRLPMFRDFAGTDLKGKRVSLGGMTGKVILVCFWSPENSNSQRELLLVSRLFGQFQSQGLNAVAISLPTDRAMLADALDDFKLGFRNAVSGSDIAERNNVTVESLPRTYVLNEKRQVIASGLHDKRLDELVRKLMAVK